MPRYNSSYSGSQIDDAVAFLYASGSSDSLTLNGSLVVSGGITGSLLGTASWAADAISASYALSASHETIKEVSSSHADFADIAGNAYWTGSANGVITRKSDVLITGSLAVEDSIQCGFEFYMISENGDAKLYILDEDSIGEISAQARTVTLGDIYGAANNTNIKIWDELGQIILTGTDIQVVGPLDVSGGVTGSLLGTSSWADNAISSSYALSASHEIIKEVSSSHADTASHWDTTVGDVQITGSVNVSGDITGSSGIRIRGNFQTNYDTTGTESGSLKIFMGDTGSNHYQVWKSGSGDTQHSTLTVLKDGSSGWPTIYGVNIVTSSTAQLNKIVSSIYGKTELDYSGTVQNENIGVWGHININAVSGTTWTANKGPEAFYGRVEFNSNYAATINQAIGVKSELYGEGFDGALTNWYAFKPEYQFTLPVENAYNYYSSFAPFLIFGTNQWHFYGDGDYPSYFGGDVTASGDIKASNNLNVSSNLNVSGTLTIDNSTNSIKGFKSYYITTADFTQSSQVISLTNNYLYNYKINVAVSAEELSGSAGFDMTGVFYKTGSNSFMVNIPTIVSIGETNDFTGSISASISSGDLLLTVQGNNNTIMRWGIFVESNGVKVD